MNKTNRKNFFWSFILAAFIFSSVPSYAFAGHDSSYDCKDYKKDKKKKKKKSKKYDKYDKYDDCYYGYQTKYPPKRTPFIEKYVKDYSNVRNNPPFTRMYVKDYSYNNYHDDYWW